MNRRNFLKTVPLGALATAVPFALGARRAEALLHSPILKAFTNPSEENDRVLVVLFLEGGNDGLNTLVPFEDPLYDYYRTHLGFTTAAEKAQLTFKVRDDLAFNPAMNAIEPLWQEGKMGIIQNIGIENPDLSHFRGLEIWNSASDNDLLIPTGWAGRLLETMQPDYPNTLPLDPLAINMGTLGSQIFRGSSSMMDVQVPDPLTFAAASIAGDDPLPGTEGGRELGFVRELVTISNVYAERFNTLFPKYTVSKVQYPDYDFAKDLQHVAWCIAAGMKTKIYFVSMLGFDTHFTQFSKDPTQTVGHGYLLKKFADSVYAFQRDLEALGIADKVLTMTYSEFGRRISENGDWASGTDHGTTAPHFIFGTGVNGNVYGHHPDLAHLDKNGDAYNEFEFRQYYSAILGDWFGLDETLRTSILSPGRNHAPWDITFPVNGGTTREHLIKQATAYSTSRSVSKGLACIAQPNPADKQVTVSFLPIREGDVTAELFDAQGRSIERIIRFVGAEASQISFQTAQLPAGSYYIHLISSSVAETLKIVVQH